ncbi:alpha/beta hydrolase [Candidatus Gottesmanbacteria bacterium]|nr:alpha/beta hydrolase [Candidatus Gottesmanbacteria bacterium]
MKQALILQGWYQKPESNWYPWLKEELEKKKYTILLPDLPTIHTDLPDMTKQLSFINQLLTINHQTIVIGHSLGCLLGMRLAEKYSFDKLFLVAGWDFNDLTKEHRLFWEKPINHAAIKRNVKEIYCISSDNDPYVTAFTVQEMSKRLGGKYMLIKGARHFTDKDGITQIPQLLSLLNV